MRSKDLYANVKLSISTKNKFIDKLKDKAFSFNNFIQIDWFRDEFDHVGSIGIIKRALALLDEN